jgi:hypothetical protein
MSMEYFYRTCSYVFEILKRFLRPSATDFSYHIFLRIIFAAFVTEIEVPYLTFLCILYRKLVLNLRPFLKLTGAETK